MISGRFRTVQPTAPSGAFAPALTAVFKHRRRVVRLLRRRDEPPVVVTPAEPLVPVVTFRPPDRGTRLRMLTTVGSPLGFRTVGEVIPQPRAAPAPFVISRRPLDQTTKTRVMLRRPPPKPIKYTPGPTPYGASSVGIVASGGTTITMVPANLLATGTTYITDFVAVSLDAGVY